jgi:hypothetical protein
MTCREWLQEVTAYLEGALAPHDRERFEAHCGACPDCRLQVSEWRSMVGSLRSLEEHRGTTDAESERLVTLFRERGLHRPGRPDPHVPLGFAGSLVAPGDHLAYFWESEAEFTAAAGFVAAGATRGETTVLLGDDEANERVVAAIRDAGLDAGALRREDRLRFVAGSKSADALLAEIGEQIRSAVDRGAPLVRVLGNLGWGRPTGPENRELLRLEAQVTEAVRRLPVVVACCYDVRHVPGRILMLGGLECHPLVCRRDILRPNDLYLRAERFLPTLFSESGPG